MRRLEDELWEKQMLLEGELALAEYKQRIAEIDKQLQELRMRRIKGITELNEQREKARQDDLYGEDNI